MSGLRKRRFCGHGYPKVINSRRPEVVERISGTSKRTVCFQGEFLLPHLEDTSIIRLAQVNDNGVHQRDAVASSKIRPFRLSLSEMYINTPPLPAMVLPRPVVESTTPMGAR